jgi:glycosyltransferase involved in cell wall biosynthesis
MPPELSIVIPIFNEAQNLRVLYEELKTTLNGFGRPYELLFIDDGSTDESFQILADMQVKDPHVRVIRFRRNFGQTAAFSAGFAHARGTIIITSDGDGQNNPADIPRLVERLEQDSCDIVCGWRKDRKDKWLTRRLPSMLANQLISKATGVPLHDYGCSLKAFRADVVKPLRLYGEMHRFIPAIASEMGVAIREEIVDHRARRFGQSKYGLSRTIRVVLDLVTVKFLLRYSTRPLQIFGLVGLVCGLIGALITGWLGYVKLVQGHGIGDRPLLLLGILLVFSGLQFLTIGLLAEMQARTYHESQEKPTYNIREIRESPLTEDAPSPVARRPRDWERAQVSR